MATIARTTTLGHPGVKSLVNVQNTALLNDGVYSGYRKLQVAVLVKAVQDYVSLRKKRGKLSGPISRDWATAKTYLLNDKVYEEFGINIKGKEALDMLDRISREDLRKRLNRYSIGE